jgi:hypothetical protein
MNYKQADESIAYTLNSRVALLSCACNTCATIAPSEDGGIIAMEFSKAKRNLKNLKKCINNAWAIPLLGMQMGIDLGMESVQLTLDSYWHKLWHSQQIS